MSFEDLCDKYRAQEALKRTKAHPLDARVRITYDPDDLVAIHCEGVSAVIWKREFPDELKDAVANMNTAPFPNACESVSVDFTGKAHKITSREFEGLVDEVPAAIKADMVFLSQVFLKAVTGGEGILRENVSFQNPADPEKPCKGGARMPHIDGFIVRLNTIYSTNEKMGTEWFGIPTEQRDSLRAEFRAAADPETVKLKYGVQQIATGEVTIFKGGNGDNPEGDQFLHDEPVPKPGVFRLGYLIGR